MKKQFAYFILFCIIVVFVLYSKKTSIPIVAPSPAIKGVSQYAPTIPGNCHAIQENPADHESTEPDHACTPGITNPDVTQENIATTICQSGYTKTIRPPVSYTEPLKIQSIKTYAYSDTITKDYEEDHLISLELGGSPTDPKNLWPEPGASPNEKDSVENYLHKQVCNGNITLAEAQQEISSDWYKVYLQIKK